MEILHPRDAVIWLTGLDRFNQVVKGVVSSLPESGITSFIETGTKVSERDVAGGFSLYLLSAGYSSVSVICPGVIDVEINGQKIRFVTESLEEAEAWEYIVGTPAGTSVAVMVRPKGITKQEIEKALAEKGNLMITLPMPRPDNLTDLKGRHLWGKECFKKTLRRIVYEIIVSFVSDVLKSLIFSEQ